ncbi:hypothetical protein [Streptosporangium sp. NPDC023615]|uniref:hypothetical protein n=1 Tax=Streptosporangium sp. NPDC023615 TaxID=3154794 RepID=UPI0034404641
MGPVGPATATSAVDTTFLLLDPIAVSIRTDGTALVRDPRTTPPWNTISTLAGYPADVVDVGATVILEGALPYLYVTVQSETGAVARTRCLLGIPIPVTGGFLAPGAPLGPPAYPSNCSAFVNLTPPL